MNKEEIERSVKDCYSTWGKTYYDDYYGAKAPYPPVHTEILRSLLKMHGPKTLLDAGCGPASFLRDILDEGIDLYGFDLTPEMVEEAKRIFQENGRPSNNIWQGSVLESETFINPNRPNLTNYDSIVCTGVLPHIPEEQDLSVIKNLHGAVSDGGLVVLEARNQLFGLFTMNRYSYEFITEKLIRPDELATKDKAELNAILEDMKKQFRMDLPPIRKGKEGEPGYDEVLSRTHNPFVLREQFENAGFENVKVLFYHYHCLPPMFGSRNRDLFLTNSIAMENTDDWRGYFMASAFFVVGNRKKIKSVKDT